MIKNGTVTNWDDRRYFLALARETSLNKAANALGVSRSTVLRRITSFEETLGVRLFERTASGFFTTQAGDEMLSSAVRIEEEAAAADRRLIGRDSRLSGAIRVTMPGVLATHLLMPDLAAFDRAYPDIELELAPTYPIADLSEREADVAIRLSNDPPEDLVGRRVLGVARAAYVCADYLPGSERDTVSPELRWIRWSKDPSSLQWVEESDFPDIPLGAVINDPYAQLEAAKAGVGMALLPCFLADTEPDLYRMPPGTLQQQKDLWILTHEDLRNTARIRTFTRFMADAILRYRDLMEGKRPRIEGRG